MSTEMCRHCDRVFDFDPREHAHDTDLWDQCDDCICFECEERKPVQLWLRHHGGAVRSVMQCLVCITTCSRCGHKQSDRYVAQHRDGTVGELTCGMCIKTIGRLSLKMSTGEKLKRQRGCSGLTQSALADRCGLSFQNVSRWERGEFEPQLAQIRKLAKALGCAAGDLIGVNRKPGAQT